MTMRFKLAFAFAVLAAGLAGSVAEGSGTAGVLDRSQTPVPGVPPERTVPEPPARPIPTPPVTLPKGAKPNPTLPSSGEPESSKENSPKGSSGAAVDQTALINGSITVLNDLTTTPDTGIPNALIARAQAVVVIPSLRKGGFVVGAQHGRGVVSVRSADGHTWSAPAFVKMNGGSIGWQIGAESVDLVLLVMNRQSVTDLIADKFTLGTSASLKAGPLGRSVAATTDATPSTQVLAYSRARGLFAGASFDGARLSDDDDYSHGFYGREHDLPDVVAGRVQGALPPAAEAWKSALTRAAGGQ
jgi:lipid-binding SYLF domain-containing protein